jgi:hypothetical protein
MPLFPIDLTYYDRTIEIVRKNESNGFPAYPEEDFLGLMKCGDCNFYYIKTKKNGQFLELDEVSSTYTWMGCHMIIPDYFHKVDIEVYTPDDKEKEPVITYLDVGEKMSKTYNGLFALALNQRITRRIKSHKIFELLDDGNNGCATSGHNEGQSNNLDQMFFKFRNHFFLPIILSNGVVIYYAFEKEKIIHDWIRDVAHEEVDYTIGVDAPIYYDNAFGIFITKDVRLIPKYE